MILLQENEILHFLVEHMLHSLGWLLAWLFVATNW